MLDVTLDPLGMQLASRSSDVVMLLDVLHRRMSEYQLHPPVGLAHRKVALQETSTVDAAVRLLGRLGKYEHVVDRNR